MTPKKQKAYDAMTPEKQKADDEKKSKKMNIDTSMNIDNGVFYRAEKTLKKFSSIKIFMSIFKRYCKEDNLKFPEELEQINSVDYIEKFPDFIEKKNIKSKYINIINDTLQEFSTSNDVKKILGDNDLENDLEKLKENMSITGMQKMLRKIFDEKYLSLKDKIILKLRQIFNQEIESDNNRVFNKINSILQKIHKFDKNDESIKTKILYALYQGESGDGDDPNYQESQNIGTVTNPKNKIRQKTIAKINSMKEIFKHENDLNTNIKRCILAGYSVHICQYQKEMPEEQEGGGWWPFSFGKGKEEEDNPNENYINCFPKESSMFTFMFEENQDKTFVNFKNSKKTYIIYNTLSLDRNKPILYANVITIIPQKILSDGYPTGNGKCGFESRKR
jgi:hypothetical protein